MEYPACFESEEQFSDWSAAAKQVYHYKHGRMTPYCTDCTPAYAAQMQREGRCEHPEVKFYRFGHAFMGKLMALEKSKTGPKSDPMTEGKWEPFDGGEENKQDESNEAFTRAHA